MEQKSNVLPFNPNVKEFKNELDQETLFDLRRRSILKSQETSMELDPLGPGETQCGVLTDEERIVFTEIAVITRELSDLEKELSARAFEMVANAIRKSDIPAQVQDNIDQSQMFPSKEDAENFFSHETRLQHLRAVFNSSIRERYEHGAIYGVRTGFVVVRTGYKYELPQDKA